MSQREYKQVRVDEAYQVRMSDTVGTYWMLVCPDCGMPVANTFTEAHDDFHEKINSLIEPYDNAFGKEDIAGFNYMAGKRNESS